MTAQPATPAFGVLGPLQVTLGERKVSAGGPRERLLLAALLADFGRVVAVDRLVYALWNDAAPATARQQVAIGVSRLRASLAAAGAGRQVIVTAAPGYQIAQGSLDVARFEELTGQARTARDAGDAERALRLMRMALSLWRGPAFDGIARPFAEVEALRLGELRLMVTEECAGLELELGNHASVLPELRALACEYPLRERLRVHLMTALDRSGQRAAALACYQDSRQQLISALGVEPGPELRAAHQALLTTVPGSARTAAGPAQLPRDVTAFTGRTAELAALDDLLDGPARDGAQPRSPLAVITGVAGVGKTGLALRWSHRSAHLFPDGQLYADLRGYDAEHRPLPPSVLLDRFLRALGTPAGQIPASLDERGALYRTLLRSHRILVVLDNARSAAQVRPLLPGSGSCCVVVTSRDQLEELIARDGAQPIWLTPLDPAESAELLGKLAGSHRIDADAAAAIARMCGRLPLALRIAAARMASRPGYPASELARRLADEQRRLAELSHADGGVRMSLALSYRELGARPAKLFRSLGLLEAPDFAAWAAAALLGTSADEAESALDYLIRAGLLEVLAADGAGQMRYRFHDLTRLYARECAQADEDDIRTAAAVRLLGAALHLASMADSSLGNPFVYPLRGNAPRHHPGAAAEHSVRGDPVAWLEAERVLLTNAVRLAGRLGLASHAWELTCVISQFLATSRYVEDWEDCARLAASAARAAGDERGEAAALLQLADRLLEVGASGEGTRNLDRALSLLTRGGEPQALAVCWTALAFCHLQQGSPAPARDAAERALALLPVTAPAAVRGRTLTALGLALLDQGDCDTAAGYFTEVLDIQEAAGSARGIAEARFRLGTVRLHQSRHQEAIALLATAMRAALTAHDLAVSMPAQVRLGQALVEVSRFDEALPLLDEAVRYVAAADAPRLRAVALEALGRLYAGRDQADLAMPLLHEARALRDGFTASITRGV